MWDLECQHQEMIDTSQAHVHSERCLSESADFIVILCLQQITHNILAHMFYSQHGLEGVHAFPWGLFCPDVSGGLLTAVLTLKHTLHKPLECPPLTLAPPELPGPGHSEWSKWTFLALLLNLTMFSNTFWGPDEFYLRAERAQPHHPNLCPLFSSHGEQDFLKFGRKSLELIMKKIVYKCPDRKQ